jgi:outer membrane receptor protein involved in Fe transport
MAIGSSPARADPPAAPAQRIDIAASRLGDAIAELSRETGASIGADGILPYRLTPPVHGRMAIGEALRRLLAGSGWRANQVGPRAWRIERAAPAPPVRVARPEPVPAETAAPSQAEGEPIIVTALKRPTLLDYTPISASVVSLGDAAGLDGRTGSARIASLTEGLALTGLGSGRNRMFLRGVADSALNGESQSTVAILLNGARLTFAAPDPDICLVDVERVELLKGPQGALYGSGALGGIYNIVARPPETGALSLTTSATLEYNGEGRPTGGASATGNLPLSDRAALRLTGYATVSPGWIDTGARDASNRSRVYGGRATLRVGLDGNWSADIGALAQWLGSDDSQYVYQPGSLSRPAQRPERHDNDIQHIALRVSGPAGLGDVVLRSALTTHEVGDTLDATIGATSFGLPAPQEFADKRQYRLWDSEARVSGRAGRASWQAGLSWLVADQSGLAMVSDASGQSLTVDDDRRRTGEISLFGDFSLPVGSDLTLDAGGRLFRSTIRERRVIAGVLIERQRDHVGLTPTLALSWQPDPRQMVWLRYASASRPGGSDIGPTGGLEVLDSDELQSLEAGWRRSLDGGWRLVAGAWWTRWAHIQSDILLANGLIETINAGTGQIMGAEASLDGSLAAGWRLGLGAAFNNARLVRTSLPFAVDDNSLPVVPRFTLRAGLDHSTQIGGSAVSAGVQLRYIGPSHLSFDPAVDRPTVGVLDSRLSLSVARGPWLLAIAVDNPLGQNRNIFSYGNPFRFATMPQYTPQEPPRVTLTLSRNL